MPTQTPPEIKSKTYPLLTSKERLSIWTKARGMWRHRKPDPIKELKKIRGGWKKR